MPRKQRYIPKGVSEKTTATGRKPLYRDAAYQKGRRTKETTGRLLPPFTHSRVGQTISTFEDTDYFNAHMRCLNHVSADAKTAFKNLLIAMYKEGKVAGNMKDIVSAQETAFSVLGLDAFLVSFDLAYQLVLKELLANPAEDDTVGSSSTVIANWELTSFNLTVMDITNKGLVIPSCIVALVRELLFIIKLQDEYSQGSVTLPPRYLMPFIPDMTLAECQAFITEWAANNAEAKIHMDKFGIKYEVWDFEKVCGNAPELPVNDPKVISFFSMIEIFVNDGASVHRMVGDVSKSTGTDWTAYQYWFKDNPSEECKLEMFDLLFHNYDATNNPYGGIMYAVFAKDAQDYVNFVKCKYSNTGAFTEISIENIPTIILKFRSVWGQTNTLNITMTGTYLSAEKDITRWPLAEDNKLMRGTGLTKSVQEGVLKQYLIVNGF
jgi:hypothetical protein